MYNDSEYSGGEENSVTPSHSLTAPRRRSALRPPRPKVFQCDHCERAFDRPSLLAQHVLIHTGERPHQCPKCDDRSFSRTSNLYRHMRTCKGIRSLKRKTSDMNEEPSSSRHLPPDLDTSQGQVTTSTSRVSRSLSPALSNDLLSSNPPSPISERNVPLISDPKITPRGLSPDPSWGPNPLASWKPSIPHRRHPPSIPMPISQRIRVSQLDSKQIPLLSSIVATTTPSSSSLVSVRTAAGQVPDYTEAGSSSVFEGQRQYDPLREQLHTQTQTQTQSRHNSNAVENTSVWRATTQPLPLPLPQQQQPQHYSFGTATQLAAVADRVRYEHSQHHSTQTAERHDLNTTTGPISLTISPTATEYEATVQYLNRMNQQQQQLPQLPSSESNSTWLISSPSGSFDTIASSDSAGSEPLGVGSSTQRQGANLDPSNMSGEVMWNQSVDSR